VSHDLSWIEAAGAGLLQGVAAVFPISGLGHGELVGALGQGAAADVAPETAGYLYSAVRVAIGVALLIYFWRDWARVGTGLVRSVARWPGRRREDTWAWVIVLAAIPGCVGVALLAPRAKPLLGRPLLAAVCLAGNGLVMLVAWWWWRRSPRAGGRSGSHRAPLRRGEESQSSAVELSYLLPPRRAVLLGVLPMASLVPGISGVGLTITAGLIWGLTHEQAARVALLLVTPVLLTWGLTGLPDLRRAEYDNVRGAGYLAAAAALVAAYLATVLLVRYFRTASLRPFGYYCVLAGAAAAVALSRT
jgi:undecaprenyl-diphosphatase